jgi:hypothetical protein
MRATIRRLNLHAFPASGIFCATKEAMSDERDSRMGEGSVDRIDLLIASLPPGDPIRRELLDLRMEICEREETFVQPREMIEKLE